MRSYIRIFAYILYSTGATGYIGGDALSALTAKHPDISYSALVRTPEKAAQVNAEYPPVRIVIGDLDDAELLKKESADADIVLRKYMCLSSDRGRQRLM